MHLALGRGLRRAAARAGEIGAGTVQVFVDNPTAWKRRTAPPRWLDEFRTRMRELDVAPVAVHASYLVNLAGPDPRFRASSIEVLASDMVAGRGYGARIVNVHTGSHRDTSVEAGVEQVATAVLDVLHRADALAAAAGGDGADGGAVAPADTPLPLLALENASGGGWSVGTTIEELAAIADRAAALGVPESRLGFCLDTAHAWGAGAAMDEPDGVDAWLERFDGLVGLGRLAMVHLNDSRSERGSRHDRHEHVGAGRIGPRGLGHLLRHPALRSKPFVLETPGMDEGYDLVNLDRARALIAGAETLDPLPPEAFSLRRRASASAPADTDVDKSRGTSGRSRGESGARSGGRPGRSGGRSAATRHR